MDPAVPQPDDTHADDRALVTQMRGGDEQAFETLFHRYYSALVGFASGFLRSMDAAQEVVNDVFLGLWERREEVDIRGRVDQYLYSAVRNRARNWIRREHRMAHRHDEASLEEETPGMGEPLAPIDTTLEASEQMAIVWRAVDTLPEARRTVVILRWQRQMSFEEIAEVMGTTSAAVQMQLSRAMKLLRELLPDAFER